MDKKNIKRLCVELFARSGNAFREPLKSQMILDLILDIISGMSDTEMFKKYGNISNVESIRGELKIPCPQNI